MEKAVRREVKQLWGMSSRGKGSVADTGEGGGGRESVGRCRVGVRGDGVRERGNYALYKTLSFGGRW